MKQTAFFRNFWGMLLIYGVAACAINPMAPPISQSELVLPSFEEILPDSNSANFPPNINNPNLPPEPGSLQAELARFNVQLTQAEWAQISEIMQTQASGKWSLSRTKTAEENLSANFQRFAPLFTPPINNESSYLQRAVNFARQDAGDYYLDLQYYLDNKRILMAKWNAESGEFVVIQPDGSLVNYLITRAVAPPRYLKANL